MAIGIKPALFPEQLVSINDCSLQRLIKQMVITGNKRVTCLAWVNHGFTGEQVGADMVMVNHCPQTMEHICRLRL
jgi:hypothetical protein